MHFTSKWDTLFQRTFVFLVNWLQSKIKLNIYKAERQRLFVNRVFVA